MIGMDAVAGLEETNRRQAAVISIFRAYFGFGSKACCGLCFKTLSFYDLPRRGAAVSWSGRRQNRILGPFVAFRVRIMSINR